MKIIDTKKFAKEIFGATKIVDFRGFQAIKHSRDNASHKRV